MQVWDITTGQCLHTLQGPHKHLSAVTSLQFTDNFVVTSSDDGTVKLWDLKTGEFIRNLVQLDSGGNGEIETYVYRTPPLLTVQVLLPPPLLTVRVLYCPPLL